MAVTVVLAAGGTAGHVNPMLATARAIQTVAPDAHIVMVGTAEGMEGDLVRAAGFEMRTIPRVPMPRSLRVDSLKFPFALRDAVSQAGKILESVGASVVIGFGGYVSTPVYLAAWRRKIPVVAHEGNARPGLANKLGARFAKVVALTFSNTALKASRGLTVTTGLPMREPITALAESKESRLKLRQREAERFGLDPCRPVILVTGGSQGAQHINEVMAALAPELLRRGIQVLHLTGRGKAQPVLEEVEFLEGTYVVLEYLEHMEQAYSVADLVISRAGAGMVAEVSALGIPAVFVPFPIGNGEQALNAHDVVKAGGALLVRNQDFTEQWVRDHVFELFGGDRLARMAQRARQVSPLYAARELAELALGLVQ